MFARISTLFLVSLPLFAAAAPNSKYTRQTQASQCDTGSLSCCNSVQDSTSSSITSVLSLVGLALDEVSGQVGFGCSPISAIGTGSGASCSQEPVCCTSNFFNGVVTSGCSPVDLSA